MLRFSSPKVEYFINICKSFAHFRTRNNQKQINAYFPLDKIPPLLL